MTKKTYEVLDGFTHGATNKQYAKGEIIESDADFTRALAIKVVREVAPAAGEGKKPQDDALDNAQLQALLESGDLEKKGAGTLKEFAAANAIDLGEAKNKAEILKAVQDGIAAKLAA